jgi:peptidoglycan/LPS O-acetylase OafA/YrhL
MGKNVANTIHLKELDALRGIFMMMIFLFHMHLFSGGGRLGVTFFFILSGFSLTLGYKEKVLNGGFSYKSFVNKRYVKLVPIHWLTLALAVVLKTIEVIVSGFQLSIIPQFFSNLFLLQSWIPSPDYYLSFNSVSWYLSDTVFFIALFPLLIRFVARAPKYIQILTIIAVLILYLGVVYFAPQFLYVFPLVRLLDFVVGIYLGFFFLNIRLTINQSVMVIINRNTNLILLGCLLLIVSLVFETNALGDKYGFISVCYWPAIVSLIICISLIGICNGGGKTYYKKVFFSGLAR